MSDCRQNYLKNLLPMSQMRTSQSSQIDITLLVCTHNRSQDLAELLASALAQKTGGQCTYEVLVVDNNSTDETRAVVEKFIARGHENLRYLFEGRQGKSHALNTGLRALRGWAYAITDDDFILPENWVSTIYEGLQQHPEAAFVSGKVLPLWQAPPPRWLTQRHWAAIAMADYGEEKFYADSDKPLCLLACSFRLADVKAVGGYHPDLAVNVGKIGGTEDLEILQRLWKSGRKGVYLPHLSFQHKVTAARLTKDYHRRWHMGHGCSHALMREADFEQAAARLFDVPSHLYRQALENLLLWLRASLTRNEELAFWHETRWRFFQGFFRQRRRDYLSQQQHGTAREIVTFIGALLHKRHLHEAG